MWTVCQLEQASAEGRSNSGSSVSSRRVFGHGHEGAEEERKDARQQAVS